jgi:hypothetical protein
MFRRPFAALLGAGLLACADSQSESADSASADTSAAAAGITLAAGTVVAATIQEPVSSRRDANGQRVHAIVSLNVADEAGHVVIPGGSDVVLTITQLKAPASPAADDGVLAFAVTSITVGRAIYTPAATVGAVPHTLQAAPGSPTERDLIVSAGTPITITLTHALKISGT